MSDRLRQATFLFSETDPKRIKPSHAEVAVVGRSNVGKSSWINAICQRRSLAVVSQTPGRTRGVNVFEIAHMRWLVDLPGYGFAAGSRESREGWAKMIEGYLTSRPALKKVFVLIDGKVGATPLDFQMIDWLVEKSIPYQLVANKWDQVQPSKRVVQQRDIAEQVGLKVGEIYWVSATKGIGMDPLRNEVSRLIES